MPWLSKNTWGTILYPLVYTVCCFALATQEIYYAKTHCSPDEMLEEDVRWFLRTASLLVMPLTFAMTMDAWPLVGNTLKLSFDANERSPHRCCRVESIFPALLVGGSTYCLVPAIAWMYCAPLRSCIVASIGVGLAIGGFGLSWYLRDWAPCCSTTIQQRRPKEEISPEVSDNVPVPDPVDESFYSARESLDSNRGPTVL